MLSCDDFIDGGVEVGCPMLRLSLMVVWRWVAICSGFEVQDVSICSL
jgi:hypothetical protein